MQIFKYGNRTVIYLQSKGIHRQPEDTAEKTLDCSFVTEHSHVLTAGELLDLPDEPGYPLQLLFMAFPAYRAVIAGLPCLDADIAVFLQAFLDRPVMEVAYGELPKAFAQDRFRAREREMTGLYGPVQVAAVNGIEMDAIKDLPGPERVLSSLLGQGRLCPPAEAVRLVRDALAVPYYIYFHFASHWPLFLKTASFCVSKSSFRYWEISIR